MARKLNVRLLVRVTVITLLLAVGVHFVHAFQVNRQADTLLELARSAKDARDYHSSALFLNHYLGQRPDDRDARVELGMVLALAADSAPQKWRSYHVLKEAVRIHPEHVRARQQLAHLAVQLKLYKEAIDHLKPLLRVLKGGELGELSHTLGWCYRGAGDIDQATHCFEAAIRISPGLIDAYVDLANLHLHQEEPEQADQVMASLIKANPTETRAFVERARYFRKQEKWAKAAQQLDQARKLEPGRIALLQESADLARARDHIDQARAFLARARALAPDRPHLAILAAYLERDNGQLRTAIRILEESAKKEPQHQSTLAFLAEILFEAGMPQQAEALKARLKTDPQSLPWLEYFLAHQEMNQGKWVSAARRLEEIIDELQSFPIWLHNIELSLAKCYETHQDLIRSRKACFRALRADRSSRRALFELCRARQKEGHVEDALQGWTRLLSRSQPPKKGWIYKARAEIALNQKREPEQRDWTAFQKSIESAKNIGCDPTEIHLLSAEALVAQGLPALAQANLTHAIKANGKDIRLHIALSNLFMQAKSWQRARVLLDQAEKALGDQAQIRASRIFLALQSVRMDRSTLQRLSELKKDLDPFPTHHKGQIFQLLATAHARGGSYAEAMRLCLGWIDLEPYNLSAQLALFDLAYFRWSEKLMDQAISGIRHIEGEWGIRWRCASALRWMGHAKREKKPQVLDHATRLLQEAERIDRRHPRVLLLQGRLAESQGQMETAITKYLMALDARDYPPGTVEHVVRLLYDTQQFPKAEEVYRKIANQGTASRSLARIGADIAIELRLWKQLGLRARRAVDPQSKDYREHLWLAGVYQKLGRLIEAEQMLEQLVQRFPKIPDTWIALVSHFVATDKRERAEVALQQMAKRLRPGDVRLSQARCYEVTGERDKAEKAYLEVYQQRQIDPFLTHRIASFYLHHDDLQKALPFLNRITHPRLESPLPQIEWANRIMALILAGFYTMKQEDEINRQEQQKRIEKAVAILGRGSKEGKESVQNRRARALIAGTLPGQRGQALNRYEETLDHPITPEEQFHLALLYKAHHERARAEKTFGAVLTREPRNARYLAAFVRMLLEEGAKAEARSWLYKLELAEPDTKRTKDLKKMAN